MSTKNEESTLEKVERELEHFKAKKTSSESLLKEELAKAKKGYEDLVKEINLKYNLDEVSEDIKRHTYFLRLLKGEIAIPDDLNAKKTKLKSGKAASPKGERVPFPLTMPNSYAEGKNWNEKLVFIIGQIGEGTNDDIIAAIAKIDKSFNAEASGKTINLTLSKLKGAGNIATKGKGGVNGKKDIYTSAVK